MKKFLYSNIFFLFFLALSVFAVYGKSLSFKFVDYDNPELITNKIAFISDFRNIPKFFVSSCFGSKEDVYYRPVLTLSFALNAIFAGDNPFFYYLTNIFLFIGAVYSIYFFLSKLKFNETILKFICLIIAVHPVCVSSVAWVPARNDTLLIIFLSLSFGFFTDYLEKGKIKYLTALCLFFTAALFTKETAVILLPVYFFIVYFFDFKITKKKILTAASFLFLILMFYFFMRYVSVNAINVSGHIKDYNFYDTGNKFLRIFVFIKKVILPDNIPIFVYNSKFTTVDLIILAAFFLIFAFAYFKKIIGKNVAAFAAIFFALNMFLVFAVNDLAFHRILFSLVSAIMILTAALTYIVEKWPVSKKYLFFLFACIFLSFGYISFVNADKYRNSDIFWLNAFAETPEYDVVWNGMGKRYFFYGNYGKAKEFMEGAKKIKNLYDYDLNLATVCIAEGNLNEAENMLLKLLKLKEKLTTLLYLSEIAYVKGETEKSYEYAQRAYKIEKNNVVLLRHMAKLHMDRKDFDKAAEKYKELIKYDGGNKDYYNNLSIAFERSGNKDESLKYARKAAEFEYINK